MGSKFFRKRIEGTMKKKKRSRKKQENTPQTESMPKKKNAVAEKKKRRRRIRWRRSTENIDRLEGRKVEGGRNG